MKSIAAAQVHDGMRKSKPLLPKIILPQCVAAGQLVGVASFESTKQLIPAEDAVSHPREVVCDSVFCLECSSSSCRNGPIWNTQDIGQILAPFTEKQVQESLTVASVNAGHLHQKGMKGKSTSIPGLMNPQSEL